MHFHKLISFEQDQGLEVLKNFNFSKFEWKFTEFESEIFVAFESFLI